MDLDRCPRCGNAWKGGEKCRTCGFVPIGAGLAKLPKKKRKRHGRYVEPGSSRGFLSVVLLGVVGWGLAKYQPWTDDWELIRSLLGQGRHHSLVGEWDIVKTLSLSPKKAVISADKGLLKFNPDGKVAFNLHRGDDETSASGTYAVLGEAVAVTDIRNGVSEAGALPPGLNLRLAWTGPDSLVASCAGSEALYLRRHRIGHLAEMLRLGLKPGQDATPGKMRGVVATESTQVSEDKGGAN
jgi:hypothetical protein